MIEDLHDLLIDLQRQYPLSTTYPETQLDDYTQTIIEDDYPGANPATQFITESVNCAFTKLKEYYDLTDRSTWYIAGLVLNPTLKWEYLADRWEAEPNWLRAAKIKVRQLWQQYKATSAVTSTNDTAGPSQTSTQLSKKKEDTLNTSLYRWKTKKALETATSEMKDQYDQYLAEAPMDIPTPKQEGNEEDNQLNEGFLIRYWRMMESKWPELARFAYDALSIPAMSTECERCFSSGSRTIDSRFALDADSLEACECQGQWI
jgi:hypothetical protein